VAAGQQAQDLVSPHCLPVVNDGELFAAAARKSALAASP
jgi:hypothetical protein